jgi:hypothetical protein
LPPLKTNIAITVPSGGDKRKKQLVKEKIVKIRRQHPAFAGETGCFAALTLSKRTMGVHISRLLLILSNKNNKYVKKDTKK